MGLGPGAGIRADREFGRLEQAVTRRRVAPSPAQQHPLLLEIRVWGTATSTGHTLDELLWGQP